MSRIPGRFVYLLSASILLGIYGGGESMPWWEIILLTTAMATVANLADVGWEFLNKVARKEGENGNKLGG